MKDHIIRATAADGRIRAFAASTRELTEEARRRHGTFPTATAALGRLMTAGAMMGAMMKGEDDILTLKVEGNGPLGGIVVTADSRARVKGYVYAPQTDLPLNEKGKLDVAGAVGIGVLTVIRDIGLKEPYSGQTILVTSEIAEDLTYYFATSEQVPSSVGLGVLVSPDDGHVMEAGGFIIQMMPEATEEEAARLEENLKKVTSVTHLLHTGMMPRQILELLLGDQGLVVLDEIPTGFYCNCSRDRVTKALISVGRKDLTELIESGEPVTLNCHFCNTDYVFETDELREILARA